MVGFAAAGDEAGAGAGGKVLAAEPVILVMAAAVAWSGEVGDS